MCQTVATVRNGDIVELTFRTRNMGGNGRWDGTSTVKNVTACVVRSELTADGAAFDVDYRLEDGLEGECRLARDPSQQPTWGVCDWRLVGHTMQRV